MGVGGVCGCFVGVLQVSTDFAAVWAGPLLFGGCVAVLHQLWASCVVTRAIFIANRLDVTVSGSLQDHCWHVFCVIVWLP